jgi:(R,R)-butanediol dehydrogenase/meso-butanediol dehydrogenase/diacetyl reductase
MFPVEKPHPVTGHEGPMIPGHEFAGTVAAIGEGVDGFDGGELVVSGAGVSCGSCHWCSLGRTNLCANYSTVGLQRDGGLAEYVVVPAATVVSAAPYGLSADWAALGQPMSIAVHAMRRGRLEPGEVAVVIGVGGIGAFLTYALHQHGATTVVSDLDDSRLDIAADLGAEHVAVPGQRDASALLTDEGLVPSVVYEVSGTPSGLQAAFDIAPPGCRVVLVGLQGDNHDTDLRGVSLRELELIGTNAHVVGTDLPEALRLLSLREEGWADVAPTALPLDRLVPDGLQPLADHRSQAIKTLVDPWADGPRDTAG